MIRSVIDVSDAAIEMMKSLGLVGSYDVRHKGSRSMGWVGKPGEAEEVAVTVTIEPLPPMPGDAECTSEPQANKITLAELQALFGETMPIEAFNMIASPEPNETPDAIRAKLKAFLAGMRATP